MQGARPFGVIAGSAQETRIAFFKKDALVGFDWTGGFGAAEATRLFRFAARCEKKACGHFADDRCSLGQRVKADLPSVVDKLPRDEVIYEAAAVLCGTHLASAPLA